MAKITPVGLGAVMGMMMLWMIHTGSSNFAAGFILAHVAVGLVAAVALAVAAKFGLRGWFAWLERVHRPRLFHLVPMLGGAIGIAALACAACAAGLMGMM